MRLPFAATRARRQARKGVEGGGFGPGERAGADQNAAPAQIARGDKAGLVGQVVAEEQRGRAAHATPGHQAAHGLPLVAPCQPQFGNIAAMLDDEAMDRGQLRGECLSLTARLVPGLIAGRMGALGRDHAPVEGDAIGLFLDQHAGKLAREHRKVLGHLVERGRAFRAGPDPVPAIFEAMAAGDGDGLGDGAKIVSI
jgi:hypothetical protein